MNEVPDLESLYSNYPRLSSVTLPNYVRDLAKTVADLASQNGKVVEVATNDGIFLQLVKEYGAKNVLGIDSGQNCIAATRARGIDAEEGFFSFAMASELLERYGRSEVIVARHIVEHIDNVDDFMSGVSTLLSEYGTLVLEVPDFRWAIERGDFTSFTEQHLSYFSPLSLKKLLDRFGFNAQSVRVVPNNWSDALLVICKRKNTSTPKGSDENELKPIRPESAGIFTKSAETTAEAIKRYIDSGPTVLFGAFCRTANLLNYTELSAMRSVLKVIDDDARKTGLYLPGTCIQISTSKDLYNSDVKYCVITAVNYENRIMEVHHAFSKQGRFITLFPTSEA